MTGSSLRKRPCRALAVALLMGVPVAATAEDRTLDDALKQMDKATEGLRGLTGDATALKFLGGR